MEITLQSTGSRRAINWKVRDLRKECAREGVAVEVASTTTPGVLPELIVAVAGGVSVHVISRLIDTLLRKFRASKSSPVVVVHLDVKKSFLIPQEHERCRKHFEGYRERIPLVAPDDAALPMLGSLLCAPGSSEIHLGLVATLTSASLNGQVGAAHELVKALLRHTGRPSVLLGGVQPKSHRDLYSEEALPPDTRLYALGLSPYRDLKGETALRALTRKYREENAQFLDLEALLDGSRPMQTEILKVFILSILLAAVHGDPQFHESKINQVADKVMTSTEIIEGTTANADFKFGRFLWMRVKTVDNLALVVGHELAHNLIT